MAIDVSTYRTARVVLAFLMIIGWFLVFLGVVAVVAGTVAGFSGVAALQGVEQALGQYSGASAALGAVPGLLLALIGLFSVASNQVGLAILDTSVATQRTAAFLRDGGGRTGGAGSVALRTEPVFAPRLEQ